MSALPPYLAGLQQSLQQEQTKAAAWRIVDDYLDFVGIEEATADLWLLLVGALTNPEVHKAEKPIGRHNLIFFYEHTVLFLQAVAVLQAYHLQKHKTPGHGTTT